MARATRVEGQNDEYHSQAGRQRQAWQDRLSHLPDEAYQVRRRQTIVLEVSQKRYVALEMSLPYWSGHPVEQPTLVFVQTTGILCHGWILEVRQGRRWKCDGYDTPSPPATDQAAKRPLLPLTKGANTIYIPKNVSTLKFSVTDTDRSAFAYFTHKTYPDILIVAPLRETMSLALQLSFSTAPLFYAITALGCAHRSLPFIMDAKLDRYYRDGSRATGKWQYGKALAALQSHLRSTSITEDAVIPVLLVCMLFGCFELMEDRSSAAIAHFQFGRGIILDHLRRYGFAGSVASSSPASLRRGTTAQVAVDGPLHSQPGTIPPRLVETFFGMIDHDPMSEHTRTLLNGELSTQPMPGDRVMPQKFLSIEDARSHLDPLLESTTNLCKELREMAEQQVAQLPGAPFSHAITTCLSLCISRGLDLQAHTSLSGRFTKLRTALAAWSSIFTPLTTAKRSSQSVNRALALMQIQHFTSTFTLTALSHKDEAFTDALDPEFLRVLDLCEQYLHSTSSNISATGRKACQPSPAETQQDGFSLDLRILPALNLIVHRCRYPGIRRRALNILKTSNRREGLIFSQVLCLSGEAYIEIEEGRVPHLSPITPPLDSDLGLPTRFAETLTAGSDATGTDTRYFLDPIVTTPQAPSLPPNAPPWRYAEVLVAGNTGPPPSMTMWCGRFVGEGHVGRGGGGVEEGVEIVEYRGEGWPVRMGRVGSTVYAYA
ncbi:hypothetical protein LTR35_009298 [Friedmanniomyces endolithicus]|nr:hypothetical protein LTS00_015418 [Friedmanniomyces endolithicus]KAK0278559.1 hypothetical protein LTR35_009298 [Friedmanniomyces endolithicus]KAK0993732.1 hypothetical protein LTR54_011024 [Friedmanniomyces endolithicus]